MDMCSAGMKAKRRDGTEGPARNTSGWITSAREVAEELSRFQCPNRAATPEDPEPHDHVDLVDGKARATEQCPPRLVAALLRAIRRTLVRNGFMSVSAVEVGLSGHEEISYTAEEAEKYYDEMTGALLPAEAVRAARADEIE